MGKMIGLLKMLWVPAAGCIVAFGILFYVLFKIPLTGYLILIAGLSLFLSIFALRECRRSAGWEHENYEQYRNLRNRVEELERLVEDIADELKEVRHEKD
jgi:hypothetical protein